MSAILSSAISLNMEMGNTKQINIKDRKYYSFNDIINIKGFDISLIKIDKKSYKNIGIYHIGYITIKIITENINSINPLYLMIGEVDGYIEEINGNKYLTFASTDKKKLLEKYTKLWDKIKCHIQTINRNKSGEYKKNDMKIKFNSDYNLPLNKILKFRMLRIIVRSVFEEDGKCYPQVFLDECLYEV